MPPTAGCFDGGGGDLSSREPGCGSRLYDIRPWARSASCEISKALTKSFNVIGQLS